MAEVRVAAEFVVCSSLGAANVAPPANLSFNDKW